MDGLLLEPIKYYKFGLADTVKSNFTAHFNSLVSNAGTDVEENRKTVKKYKKELAHVEKMKKRLFWLKFLSVTLIILAVLGVLSVVLGISMLTEGNTKPGWIFAGTGAGLALVSLLFNFLFVRKKIKNSQATLDKHQENANKLLSLAEEQMAKLNSLFDNEDTFRIIEKSMPEIKFNRTYTNELESLFLREFDYLDFSDDDKSVVDVLSGLITDNPFLFERYYEMKMGTATYTGALPISWTETRRDSNGKTRIVRRSQVLHASLIKPKPFYRVNTYLSYGAAAAPDLIFSRTGSHVEDLSEEEREKRVKAGEKKLAKKARKALSKGDNFQGMANTEFDVLFGATNRNHEVQFRVLYTPLAQKNTIDLITTETGYGDDFQFIKQKRYNIIRSEHAQNWRIHPTARLYRSYDVDDAYKRFMTFNEDYFKALYFDFAPLMCIPAYHEEPGTSSRPQTEFNSNYPRHELEAMANAVGINAFKHPDSASDIILKVNFISKIGEVDRVEVRALSFMAAPRLDFVPTLGGDGRMHAVPVNWIEYIPIERISHMAVRSVPHTEKGFVDRAKTVSSYPEFTAYYHGLMAFPIPDGMSDAAIQQEFNKFI